MSTLLRELSIGRPLAFQRALFEALMEQGAFRRADPDAVALAFWGPILTLLADAEACADLPEAPGEAHRRLQLHLAHFARCHVADEEAAR